jgi:uncharacterized protein YbbK (DUF523 family)
MASRPNKPSPKKYHYKFLVSACLAGVKCAYDGKARPNAAVKELVENKLALAVCPEMLGGMGSPRERCEISGGDGDDVIEDGAIVMTRSGRNVSRQALLGARRALGTAKKHGIRSAIMKSNSPSCGYGRIYDGTFSGSLRNGAGVTASLLRRNGIKIRTERGLKR